MGGTFPAGHVSRDRAHSAVGCVHGALEAGPERHRTWACTPLDAPPSVEAAGGPIDDDPAAVRERRDVAVSLPTIPTSPSPEEKSLAAGCHHAGRVRGVRQHQHFARSEIAAEMSCRLEPRAHAIWE